jgi:hypothetical protein
MRITISILAVFLCLLTSCDPVLRAELVNKTDRKILLKINFDSTGINYNYGKNKYLDILKSFSNEPGVTTLSIDTLNLTETFILNPKAKITLVEDIRGPRYDMFNKMEIIVRDTIFLNNKEEIKNAFKKTGSFKWQLIVK